ncbi:hypothetical protein NSE01_27760 [Novosphingobium sediminis]|uniref:Inner membrane protein n=1 Tax=Novosphingobium sediminis TaxID=707214 RepID=A0A512AMN2_9SPHN|nr:hypothetical protein [Novosphingobium sediminis]GEO00944.1 hypothetical protein NSE01_27760 [Novosphingobium sediminis]
MQDMTFGSPLSQQRTRSGRGRVALAVLLILAALAGGLWYGWKTGWLEVHVSGLPEAPVPSPSASMSQAAAQTTANLAATDAALTAATAKVSALEQRLAELNQQAAAAAGQATQAEALLVAFAARRAIERGQPLGYLETQLRVRFGSTQQSAVDRVIAAAQKPVTLALLNETFEKASPQLIGGAASEGTWEWMTRQMSELFVIRHADSPSPTAESRAARVREALAGGRIDVAIAEVERMPGKDAATEWLAHARDFVAAERALDQLETAALSFPPTPPVAKPEAAPAPTPSPSAEAGTPAA